MQKLSDYSEPHSNVPTQSVKLYFKHISIQLQNNLRVVFRIVKALF